MNSGTAQLLRKTQRNLERYYELEQAPDVTLFRTVTAGVNWYATRFLRISPDVVFERYNRALAFSGGRTERGFAGFLLRVQVDF